MASSFNPLEHPACLMVPRHLRVSAWHEHIPFAMMAVQLLQPRVFVELGVHRGHSYLAFCQAVAALETGTACFGVDTWRGDEHAGFYGDEILAALRNEHDPLYGGFSRLVQSTFDQAVSYFSDGAIDLLHIDGLHTYEAVRHDWETWRSKLSERAVVLFHDINVRERDFGVWRLWEEQRQQYRHYEFKHGHGLGVLAVGAAIPEPMAQLLSLDAHAAPVLAELLFALGNRITLQEQLRHAREYIDSLQQHIQRQSQALTTATQKQAEQAECIQSLQAELRSRDQLIAELRAHTDKIVTSVSFRLGMAATAPLRWVLDRRE